MFAIDYFGNSKRIIDTIETERENLGTQSRIYDYNTGIYARILPTTDGFTLAESGDTSCGFLFGLYRFGKMFNNAEKINQSKLMQQISAAINEMNLSSDEVNELFQTGFLHMISKRNIEFNENPDFQTVLRAEELCRTMESEGYITYSEVLEEIENRLNSESIDVNDKKILMALKQVYNNYMFKSSRENDPLLQEKKEKIPERKSTPKENVFYINGGELTKQQIIDGIKEEAFDYYELIDVIRQDEDIRHLVFSKLISLDYYSEEFKSYKKLLDEINEIRMKEAEEEEKLQLQQLKAKLSSLREEEKAITIEESSIKQQKEGQDIGEE